MQRQREWWRSVISLLEDLDSDVADEPARAAAAPGLPEFGAAEPAQLPSPPPARSPARGGARRAHGRPDGDEPAAALERARRLSRAPRDEFYSPAAYERDLLERDAREEAVRRTTPAGLRRAQAIVAVPTAASARAATRDGVGRRGATTASASSSLDTAGGRADAHAARAAVSAPRAERAISAPARERQAAAAPQPRRQRVAEATERARSASPQRAPLAREAAPAALPLSPVMSVEPLPPPPSGTGPARPKIASAAEQLETTKRQLRRAMTVTHELSATNDRLRAQLAERDKKLSSHEARKKLGTRQSIEQQQLIQALTAKLEDKDAQLRELQAKLREMERAAKPRSESERQQAHNHVLNLQRQLVRLKAQLSEEFPTREHPFESALDDAGRLRTEHERRWRTERVKVLDLTRALEEARARIADVERERDALRASARAREPRASEATHAPSKPTPAQHESRVHAPAASPRGEELGYWIAGIALPAQPGGAGPGGGHRPS